MHRYKFIGRDGSCGYKNGEIYKGRCIWRIMMPSLNNDNPHLNRVIQEQHLISKVRKDTMTPKEQTLDEIIGEVFMAGIGIAAADDIEGDEKDKAILNTLDYYVNKSRQSLLEELKKHATNYVPALATTHPTYQQAVPLSSIEKLLGSSDE